MNDPVERAAVLDAITESINQFGGRYTAEQLNMWGLFTQMVQELPSAEPEIIRCKDCLIHGVCRFEQGLGLDGYCSQAERRTDG